MTADVKIQANIVGFGQPQTVYALLKADTDMLVIAKVVPLNKDRFKDSVVISNADGPRDVLFNDGMLMDSIVAFFERQQGGKLDIADNAVQANPAMKIEEDGINKTGRLFRFAADVTGAQIAVVAICLYAQRRSVLGSVESMSERLASLDDRQDEPVSGRWFLAGDVISI